MTSQEIDIDSQCAICGQDVTDDEITEAKVAVVGDECPGCSEVTVVTAHITCLPEPMRSMIQRTATLVARSNRISHIASQN